MNIRIKFEKFGCMRFLGHLDLMRYFQRALRRAGMPLEFSKGFHPHPIMSFAQPLSVGVTSSGEYFDLKLKEDIDPNAYIQRINFALNEGIRVSAIEILEENSKNAMSIICSASYLVLFKNPYSEFYSFSDSEIIKILSDFMAKNEVIYTKKTKKSEITKDIRPFIYEMKLVSINMDNPFFLPSDKAIMLFIKSGSEDNLTPIPVVRLAFENSVISFNPDDVWIHRIDLFTTNDVGHKTPLIATQSDIYS